jgi:hypothetical protein
MNWNLWLYKNGEQWIRHSFHRTLNEARSYLRSLRRRGLDELAHILPIGVEPGAEGNKGTVAEGEGKT